MSLRKLRENSQIIAMLFAIVLALAAQYFFTGEIFTHQKDSNTWEWLPKYSLALVLLILAIGFAAWAAFLRNKAKPDVQENIRFLTGDTQYRWIWLAAAGASYLLSILVYAVVGENSWVRFLWLAGIALLLIPFWVQTWGKPAENRIPTWEWLLISLIVLQGCSVLNSKCPFLPPRRHLRTKIATKTLFSSHESPQSRGLQ